MTLILAIACVWIVYAENRAFSAAREAADLKRQLANQPLAITVYAGDTIGHI